MVCKLKKAFVLCQVFEPRATGLQVQTDSLIGTTLLRRHFCNNRGKNFTSNFQVHCWMRRATSSCQVRDGKRNCKVPSSYSTLKSSIMTGSWSSLVEGDEDWMGGPSGNLLWFWQSEKFIQNMNCSMLMFDSWADPVFHLLYYRACMGNVVHIFWVFIKTTAYHLDRHEPVSPSCSRNFSWCAGLSEAKLHRSILT